MTAITATPRSTPALERRVGGPGEGRAEKRAAELYAEHLSAIYKRTDRLFGVLMLVQWVAGILAAWFISPRTWSGAYSRIHPHVYAAVILGGIIASLPIFLVIVRPGAVLTRQVVAVSQMLFSALLIHLTGGRIETHFHVFGSLAFLAVYRDWRVLATASAVIGLDHFVRGIVWPQSVFGVAMASNWRWLEHVGWVAFEDIFLLVTLRQSLAEMRATADRQAAVEAAKELVEAADRAKTAFLANMSHEIRTPLTAILGYNELMRSAGESEADRAECVQTIDRNGQHLLAILNDILDLSKIEAGQLRLEMIQAPLGQTVAEATSLLRPLAVEKGLALEVTFETPVPESVTTDPIRLRQILGNLLSNAIKFTETGRVSLAIGMTSADGSDGTGGRQMFFRVSDTGIGIPREQQAKLFQPFSQADSSSSRRYSGTGLGLSICRRLAGLLGGRITLHSEPGAGSTFTLYLPMGPLDGVPIVTLTSADSSPERATTTAAEDERHATSAGRPGNGQGRRMEGGAPAARSELSARGRVLLADDSPDNQRFLKKLLQSAGLRVEAVCNGALAVQCAMKAAADDPFDVILMDMQMPELDGYDASSSLRASGYTGRIVALTAHASEQDRERCILAGCDDYLSKPFDFNVLLDKIQYGSREPRAAHV